VSTCRDCRATIRFVRLESGKSMPVNPMPDETGTVAADWQGRVLVGYVLSKTDPLRPGYRLYRAHRADCSDKPRVPRPASLLDDASPASGHHPAPSPRRTR